MSDLTHLLRDFDRMLSTAPQPEQNPIVAFPGSAPDQAGAASPLRKLSSRHGWPEKWCRNLGEPQGDVWYEGYRKATRIVETGGILILHGTRGVGKTRMASELAKRANHAMSAPETVADPLGGTRKRERRHSVYRTAMGFFLEVRDTYRPRSTVTELEVIQRLIEPGLLVLDEVQERSDTVWENRLLTHLIDARYSAERPTLLIANLTEEELIASLGPSIVDRARENGGTLEMVGKSYRIK